MGLGGWGRKPPGLRISEIRQQWKAGMWVTCQFLSANASGPTDALDQTKQARGTCIPGHVCAGFLGQSLSGRSGAPLPCETGRVIETG